MPISPWSGDDLNGRHYPDWLMKFTRIGCFGAICSFIPGLAHLIQKRFHTIRWWVLSWAILLPMSLFMFGSSVGMFLLGLAIGVHVWIAVHSALLREHNELHHRVIGYLIILGFYFFAYHGLGSLIFYNIPGGYSVVDSPASKIHHGDFMLGRRSQIQEEYLTRGSFVLAHLSNVGGNLFRQSDDLAYVQIVGLPGDIVAIENGSYLINGEIVDGEQFPVPNWIKRYVFSKSVPNSSYFISANYQGAGYDQTMAVNVCIIPQNQIEAKAFMRWIPLSRRGFIRESE